MSSLVVDIFTTIITNFFSYSSTETLIELATLLVSLFTFDPLTFQQLVPDTVVFSTSYDFIVVGTGTAGSVMANRLTEIEAWDVLALEAGGNENAVTEIPTMFFYELGTSIDWKYQDAPSNQYCLAMNNNQCNLARGKILGGTSALNAMVYIRGNKMDFDSWSAAGCQGWSYNEVLPYFLKSEDNQNPQYVAETPTYHQKGGYLTVSEANYKTIIADAFVGAMQEVGYAQQDVNGANQTGVMYTQATMKDGTRMSAARAFLRPIKDRPNLHVSMNSHVTKILIDPITKRAYGVQFTKNDIPYEIMAKKEVILSAGAIGSPQLLMLSGVGPSQQLQHFNIPVLSNLPVGNNMQDHLRMDLQLTINKTVPNSAPSLVTAENVLNYTTAHQGPLSGLPAETVAFTYSSLADPSQGWPDIQFHASPFTLNDDKQQFLKITNMRQDFYDQTIGTYPSSNGILLTPFILRPKSTGTVTLQSADSNVYPVITPNHLSHPDDVTVLLDGIHTAVNLCNTNSFKAINATLITVPLPGCENLALGSDAYYTCAMKEYAQTVWHPAGTCKMGPTSDPSAVVDPRLRVYGVQGLRVVDASIMPNIVSGNLQATVMMSAEKAADMVKQDYAQI